MILLNYAVVNTWNHLYIRCPGYTVDGLLEAYAMTTLLSWNYTNTDSHYFDQSIPPNHFVN